MTLDPHFVRMYEAAVKRDCPAIWHYVIQRGSGCAEGEETALARCAAGLVENDNEFHTTMATLARRMGYASAHDFVPVCPLCGSPACGGAYFSSDARYLAPHLFRRCT